ncbi:DUF4132 domain-containing protein [Streptomyces sp. SGAir0957]
MNELTSPVRRLRAVLTEPPPSGAGRPPSRHALIAQLTPLELGGLLPLAHRVLADEAAPEDARRVARELTWSGTRPAYTADACAELLTVLAERPRPTDVRLAAAALDQCAEPYAADARCAGPAAVLVRAALDAGPNPDHRAQIVAVAALAGPAVEAEATARLREALREAPLALLAFDALLAAPARDHASLLADDAYARAARRVMTAAAEHLAALHRGELPYAADTAFPGPDGDALRQAVDIALGRDEPWAGELLAAILPRVAVAPTTAKTLPSQSVCIGLAQSVEELPTPEALDALRAARRVVRHAGVAKKLERGLRRAEKNLGGRPEVALRLPDLGIDAATGTRRIPVGAHVATVAVPEEGDPVATWERADDGTVLRSVPAAARRDHPDEVAAVRALVKQVRAQRRTLLIALENGFVHGTVHRYGRWRAALAEHPVARTVTRRLVWETEHAPGEWRAFLPAGGAPLPDEAPSAAVRLWHPARVSEEERALWRERVTALGVEQPLRQVFRERYAPPETGTDTTLFNGPELEAGTVLGLAVREGWTLDDDVLVRRFGPVEVLVHLGGSLYPGRTGPCSVEWVRFSVPLAELDPVLRSEALRAVDLLVSVGGG